MNNRMKITISMLAVVALLFITAGVTLAYFSYKGVGKTENTISVGGITFHYKEINGKGHGISITDALPAANNETAKSSDKYFDFKITSTTMDGVTIPYTVTARMDSNSDSILGNIINIYLTEINGTEAPTSLFSGDLVKYNELENYKNNPYEKIIYTDTVSSASYEKNFRLRMWIDARINMNTGNGQSDYNNKTFSITVNVYATGANQSPAQATGLTGFAKVLVDAAGGQAAVEARSSSENNTMLADQDNDGTTYYYKGQYDNNFVEFAGQLWRVIRVNGDSSIRMIAYNPIGQENKLINQYPDYSHMTLSNSYYFSDYDQYAPYYYFRNQTKIIPLLESWYAEKIDIAVPDTASAKYSDYVVENAKFCEAVKTVGNDDGLLRAQALGYQNVTKFDSSYQASYSCPEDSKGHQYYTAPVAFITLDELLKAGYPIDNSGVDNHFLDNRADFENGDTSSPRTKDDSMFWTMSTAGVSHGGCTDYWRVDSWGISYMNDNGGWYPYRPVINLKNDITVVGEGTELVPYRIVFE